jgi:hypothetical protein
MAALNQGPALTKGAIVALDPANPVASVIIFQYNPAELTRSLTPPQPRGDSTPVGTQRLTGPPAEKISIRVTINAEEQLGAAVSGQLRSGIYPQLAALEMLMYPKTALVIGNAVRAALGTMEVQPPEAPLTLFIWGARRVIPVQVEGYSVTEQYHDSDLNPLIAQADLQLKVLTYQNFTRSQAGYYMFMSYQVVKEAMATVASVGNIAATGASIL